MRLLEIASRCAAILTALCLLVLASDVLLRRINDSNIQRVYVHGGSVNASVESIGSIDEIGGVVRVDVEGGLPDLPTDQKGRLYVVPMKECAGVVC